MDWNPTRCGESQMAAWARRLGLPAEVGARYPRRGQPIRSLLGGLIW